ncbi:MAG: hypothetical protein NZ874_01785 [Fimbriimonadales bacterium]|nr:hypothetical protein [Fimbriimonadales bacterium]
MRCTDGKMPSYRSVGADADATNVARAVLPVHPWRGRRRYTAKPLRQSLELCSGKGREWCIINPTCYLSEIPRLRLGMTGSLSRAERCHSERSEQSRPLKTDR